MPKRFYGNGHDKEFCPNTTKNSATLLTLEVSLTLVRNADEVHLVAMFTSSAETAYNEWKWSVQGLDQTNIFQTVIYLHRRILCL